MSTEGDYITLDEAARMLDVSAATLNLWRACGKLQAVEIIRAAVPSPRGGPLPQLVSRPDLQVWMERHQEVLAKAHAWRQRLRPGG